MVKILPEAEQVSDNQRWFPLQNVFSGKKQIIQPGHNVVSREQTGMIEPCFKPRAGEVTTVNQKNFEHILFAVG